MNTEKPNEAKYLERLLKHIENVRENCFIVGKHLIESGDIVTGRVLIQNGLKHDNSKFTGIEWDLCLYENKKLNKEQTRDLQRAIEHHTFTNPHHPEYWNGIKNMPEVCVAEMVCDWKARSTEFGTDLRDWIEKIAKEKYDFCAKDPVYIEIYKYVEMLCAPTFNDIK